MKYFVLAVTATCKTTRMAARTRRLLRNQKRQARPCAGHPAPRSDVEQGVRLKFSNLLPVTIGTRGEDHEPRNYESFQSDDAGSGLRPDPDFNRVSGEDSVVVLRRNQEAGDHQLPHLQARA